MCPQEGEQSTNGPSGRGQSETAWLDWSDRVSYLKGQLMIVMLNKFFKCKGKVSF